MHAFEKRPIPGQHKAKNWIKSHIALSVLALIFGFFTLRGVLGAFGTGNPLSIKQIFFSAVGSAVKMDNYGHTNILLIGIGGGEHDGANLTDTMIVASLDQEKKIVSMISIPRDLYVDNDAVGWGTRLNSVYEYVLENTDDPQIAMATLEKQIEDILDVDIHYYAKIDFDGFTEIVDALGGITVNVETAIADDMYPAPDGSTTFYEPFYLNSGAQELDGETTLKYVRSRHYSSDFDRARRQQEVLAALKDKALSLGVLGNPAKIKDIYYAISKNFETNMTLTEMLNLVGFAEGMTGDSVFSAVINEEANKMGGFLYTPPREDGEPYYLVPYAENFSELQTFAQLFFYHPEIYQDQVAIQVLNGTKEEGLGALCKMYLVRYGFNVTNFGNGENTNITDTRIIPLLNEFNSDEVQRTMDILPSLTFGEITSEVPMEYQPATWDTDAEIIIELGQDFADYYKEHEELFYLGVY